ncbi:protein kinase domain-containing protein [Nocardia noduli]|uniref:protein kinase domain-containing protein n=1 Tax=Nocardia noduli TaxID=2815722 RepID=UPI001C245B88|nr:protein kinase [Nocardia noduli]
MLREGEVFAGFTIQRLLGQGGMGAVYLARHPRLPRLTALKLLNPELFSDDEIRARFEREADLVARLDHPNLVTVFDRGVEDEQLWISMQYIDGVDASGVDPRTLPPQRAAQIVAETAAALDYAHAMDVLHRDVKPGNILLARGAGQERVLLTDFGIARPREDVGHLTKTGSFTATLAYAAPEQLTGGHLDHRTDQYSLACTLYWLLSATVPFDSPHAVQVIEGHLRKPPPPITGYRPDLPAELDAVLGRALAKRPTERFDSCAEFAAAVHAALSRNGSRTGTAPRSMPSRSMPRAVPAVDPHARQAGAGPGIPPAAREVGGTPVGGGAWGQGYAVPGHPSPMPPNAPMVGAPNRIPGRAPARGPQAVPPPGHGGVRSGPPPVARRPAPRPPRQRNGVTILLTVFGVIGALVAGLVIFAWQDETTVVSQLTGRSKGHQDLSAMSAAFPRMLPADNRNRGTGYDGVPCNPSSKWFDYHAETGDEAAFDHWRARWYCWTGKTNTLVYTFYAYESEDAARRALSAFEAVTEDLGTSTTGNRTDRRVSYSSYTDSKYPMIVSTFDDPARARWILTFGSGPGKIDEIVERVKNAPLG